ncbi:MAG: hypothetical protein JW810_09295 [Sedimentisphaerales bacterium]|nr:hypothetical protein [Sedimentisphaerales bacterium]
MRSRVTGVLAGLIMLGLLSCQGVRDTTQNPPGQAPPSGPRDSATLAYQLAEQTWCTNDDACSMILMMVEGQDTHESFGDRISALETKGLAKTSWNLQAQQACTKGTLAYMLYRIVDLPGGVMMHVLPGRRYAYREAVYHGLMERGSEYEPLTGPEAIGIMGRAARMKEGEQILVYR